MPFSREPLTSETLSASSLVIARLLEEARSALVHDRPLARSLIERAWSLLRIEGGEFFSTSPPVRRGGLAPWQSHRVTNHIETHLGGKIRVQELAAMVRLSPGYFARAFRRTFDETPYHYIVRRRLDLAQKTMLMSDRGLSEIAFECGFSDQAHMTKLFHQVVGESPGFWRRNRRSCLDGSAAAE